MMKRMAAVFSLLLILALTSACAAKSTQMSDAVPAASQERGVFGGAEASAAELELPAGSDGAAGAPGAERLIIRTVDMSVLVEDTDVALGQIREMVAEFGGYIADSNRWLANEQPRARITMRIPAEHLDEALDSLRSASIRVEHESSSGQDVTEEYYDVDARLRNLEATEEELLALLTEVRENRGKAEDILAIHREITSIRGQIESLKGRKQYLSQMSALATVTVEIVPRSQPGSVVQRAKWNPLVTASNALQSFVRVFQVLVDALIHILVFSVYLLVPAGVLWLVVRAIRRRQAKGAKSE